MNKIDITLKKVCSTCQTETPFHHADALMTLSEHTTIQLHVEAGEFLPCQQCGNFLYLCIKARPYELENHLDNPMAHYLYQQGNR